MVSIPEGDARHQALVAFVRTHPTYGEGHLYLGTSFLVNRFSSTLELPTSVIVLGGGRSVTLHAPPKMITAHLEKAEEHYNRAIELDPELMVPATSNIAALRLAARNYEGAIAYIEELMGEGNRSGEQVLVQHLGTAHRENGDYDTALRLYGSIAEGGPSLIHRNLALTYLRKDGPARADEEMSEQLRLHDSELDRTLARAIAAEVRGDIEDARSAYGEIASRCEFDGLNELLGANARRRAAKLASGH